MGTPNERRFAFKVPQPRERFAFTWPELRERARAFTVKQHERKAFTLPKPRGRCAFTWPTQDTRALRRAIRPINRQPLTINQPASGFTLPELRERARAFTLIELLVVIAIIIVLMAFLFPAFRGAQNQAKNAQAKNDVMQIVTAVNAFYTEYGKYPTNATTDANATYGPGGSTTENGGLFKELRGLSNTLNTRQIVFINPPNAKDQNSPRSGIKTSTGGYYDPWGTEYAVAMDANYNNIVVAPAYADLQSNYTTATDGSGDKGVTVGVIAWSYGSDQTLGTKTPASSNFKGSDDVISWQ